MKNEVRSQAFLRKRKMLLVLPLLALPFVTLAFWALGGGKGIVKEDGKQTAGLNLNLPSSNTRANGSENKLSFYDKAAKDSAKMEEWMRNDPYYKQTADTALSSKTQELEGLSANTTSKFKQQLNTTPYDGSEKNVEQRLMQRLSQLQVEINKPQNEKKSAVIQQKDEEHNGLSGDIDRLEVMLQTMGNTEAEDPEMKQLSGTLDKILDIQHPDRVKERLKEKSLQQKDAAFPVSKKLSTATIGTLDTSTPNIQTHTVNRFYSLENSELAGTGENTVEAVIANNQSIVSGAVVRVRLSTDVFINGSLVPNGTMVNGVASLNNERLNVEIKTVKCGNSILPVELTVYDLDGLEGIYVPGAITRDVAKQAIDNNMQTLELSAMDPSLKAQLASAGISTAKNLLSRKVKQVRVSLKSGYKVLLKNKDN